MTPAARVQAAIEVLDAILSGTPAEQALTRWSRASRFAGSKDRAAVRDHVFDALRRRRSFAALGGAETGRGLMIGAERARGGDFATFAGVPYGPSPLGEDEAVVPDLTAQPDAVKHDLPDWLWPLFEQGLGEQAGPVALALTDRAEVFLRVNLRKTDVAGAIAALHKDGITAEPHPLSPTALRVTENARRVAQSAAYTQGLVELQDAASQAVCDAVSWPEGGSVLDYCAGGGGKTLALAGRQDGAFTAHDANARRMKDLPARAERAGVRVEVLSSVPEGRRFDLVLCDVPCSGSGSWRRAPEGKWLLTPEKLEQVCAIQAQILDTAKDLVSEGGELAYATCSVLPQENAAQVQAFLARTPGWALVSERQFLPSDGGDGFYIARLNRL